MYSSPPIHGALLVNEVLDDRTLSAQYYQECATMAKRIKEMRKLLHEALAATGSTLDWGHVESQIGMFAFTGLTAEEVDAVTAEFFIFLTRDGRGSGVTMPVLPGPQRASAASPVVASGLPAALHEACLQGPACCHRAGARSQMSAAFAHTGAYPWRASTRATWSTSRVQCTRSRRGAGEGEEWLAVVHRSGAE